MRAPGTSRLVALGQALSGARALLARLAPGRAGRLAATAMLRRDESLDLVRPDAAGERVELSGGRPELPAGLRIYAIGDVHGRADLLAAIFRRIDHDVAARPIGRTTEILVGDYVDRGPDSRGVLDLLIDRAGRREIVALAGNHEDLMLGFLRRPETLSRWLGVGGGATLTSYGVPAPERAARRQAEAVRAALLERLPREHLAFLAGLPTSHAVGGCLFVHAGVRPHVPLRDQARSDLLWIRDEFLEAEEDFGALVIHGHTPMTRPDIRPNRINLDSGAYVTGRLTCLALENGSVLEV